MQYIVALLAVVAAWYLWPLPERYPVQFKTALVTGASSGLGAETAMQLAAEGVSKLAICARRLDKLEEVKKRILQEHSNVRVSVFSCDLSSPQSIEALKNDVLEGLGHIDILVQNAGIVKFYDFEKDSVASITQQTNVNCLGTLLVVHAFLPQMVQRGSGNVIIMSSMGGKLPGPYMAAYTGNRHCAKGFAAALRLEMMHRKTGVVIGSMHPGFVEEEGMYAEYISENSGHAIPTNHWMFGSAGTAKGIGKAVVQQIKTGEHERCVNFPSIRMLAVFYSACPACFDTMITYWPAPFDPWQTWAKHNMVQDA